MNGHHEKMQSFETLTANEILSLFDSLNIVTKLSSTQDGESELATIECTEGLVPFICWPEGNEPFFTGLLLCSIPCVSYNPFEFANRQNEQLEIARAIVRLGDDGVPEEDEFGETFIYAQLRVFFTGGVTMDHLRFKLDLWLRDLEFFTALSRDQNES